MKLPGLLTGCPKLCVCLLIFVSQFSPGSVCGPEVYLPYTTYPPLQHITLNLR